MAAPFLASDVMDEAAALLNDVSRELYTNTAQLPYLKMANEGLENILISNGVSVQRQHSTILQVASSPIDAALVSPPSDLLIPIRVWERSSGSTVGFSLMHEGAWSPSVSPNSTTLNNWIFRNNNIWFPPVGANREIQLDYWRQLSPITGPSSNEEVAGAKTYLAAKTAELCARYIGENTERADALILNEVNPAQDRLERIYIKANQGGGRTRRRRFKRGGFIVTR